MPLLENHQTADGRVRLPDAAQGADGWRLSLTRRSRALRLFLREGPALLAALLPSFGRLGERGPADGPKLMVIPGFVANDRTTLGLQRALAEAGYRVTGWGMGLNKRRQGRTRSTGSPRGSRRSARAGR